jgi:hypothetical protein
MSKYREPTSDECSAHAVVHLTDEIHGYACWYPSMGGYVGKAVATVEDDEGCVELYVWHDGEFPFGDDSPHDPRGPRGPVQLHHCSPDQFEAFGRWLGGLEPPAATKVSVCDG